MIYYNSLVKGQTSTTDDAMISTEKTVKEDQRAFEKLTRILKKTNPLNLLDQLISF